MDVRPLTPTDAAAASALMGDPSVRPAFATIPRDAGATWFARYIAAAATGGALGSWGAFIPNGDMVAIVLVGPSPRRGDGLFIGYAVAPQLWGQGIATIATARVLQEIARQHPGEAVTTSVEVGNRASVVVLERLGFTSAGNRPYLGPSGDGRASGPHYVCHPETAPAATVITSFAAQSPGNIALPLIPVS